MSEPTRFHIATLGCKINQYESQALREAWVAGGFVEVEDPALAECILVNSCAVTERALRDLRQCVRSLNRINERARILVTGCAATVHAEALAALPGVAEVLPQADKASLLHRFAARSSAAGLFPAYRVSDSPRARAVVKIQDGCSRRCAYCVVPLARGPSVSREPADTLSEIRRLLVAGLREIVLSGVNLSQYGRDFAAPQDVWDLLGFLEAELWPEWQGRARFRLSSLDPAQLTDKALLRISESRMLCPQLHLSLQSGSPEILRRMGRGHYRPEAVADFVAALGEIWPVFGLGADVLVGFPGEDAARFQETEDFCRQAPLSYAHVFPYSRRPGTAAALFPDQVAHEEKKARAAAIRALAADKKRIFAHRLAGAPRLHIVLQSTEPAGGVCEYYAACRVVGPGAEPAALASRRRELLPVKPLGVKDGLVTVERIGE